MNKSHFFVGVSWDGGGGKTRTGEICRYCGLRRTVESERNADTGRWDMRVIYPGGERECKNTASGGVEIGTL